MARKLVTELRAIPGMIHAQFGEGERGTLHVVFGEKGGMGKSLTQILTTNHVLRNGETATVFNAEYIHNTMENYNAPGFSVVDVTMLENSDVDEDDDDDSLIVQKIDLTAGHRLGREIEKCFSDHVLIDTGSSSFVPITGWWQLHGGRFFRKIGFRRFFFHTVVEAGVDGKGSLVIAEQLIDTFGDDDVDFVIWNNNHRGDTATINGRKIKDQDFVVKNPRVHVINLRIPDESNKLVIQDFLSRSLFTTQIADPEFGIDLLDQDIITDRVDRTDRQLAKLGIVGALRVAA